MPQKSTTARKRYSKGSRHGMLVAIEKAGQDRWRAALWRFRCDCGNDNYVARLDQVRRGVIHSCGCARNKALSVRASNRIKHGDSRRDNRSSEYRTWRCMLDRCRHSQNPSYAYYGGRGISVCERWHDYTNFLMDMGRKPTPRHTIGRIDASGNYEPNNCRWESPKQQARNTRRNRHVEFRGKTLTLAEACEIARISRNVVDARLRRGWPMEKALTTPVKERRKSHSWP